MEGKGEDESIPFEGVVDMQWQSKDGNLSQQEIHFIDGVAKGSWGLVEAPEQIEFDPKCKYLTEDIR